MATRGSTKIPNNQSKTFQTCSMRKEGKPKFPELGNPDKELNQSRILRAKDDVRKSRRRKHKPKFDKSFSTASRSRTRAFEEQAEVS